MEPIVFPMQTQMSPADLGVGQLKAMEEAAKAAQAAAKAAQKPIREWPKTEPVGQPAEKAAKAAGKAAEAHKAARDAANSRREKEALAAKDSGVKKATKHEKELEKAAKGASTLTDKLRELGGGANAAGGPLGGLLGKVQGLGGAMGSAGGGIGLIVGVVLAAAAAFVVASAAVAKFAFEMADAARTAKLLNAAFAGPEMPEFDSVIRQLGSKVPLARDKIGEMARSLRDARLEGIDLQRALTSMSLASVVRGGAAEAAIKSIAEQSAAARRFMLGARDIYGQFASLKGTGIKAADIYAALAESMKISIPRAKALIDSGRVSLGEGLKALEIASQKAFGPLAAAHAISFTNQMAKLKENLAGLFANVNLDRFLQGLASVTRLLDESTFTGYTLKTIATEAFTAIFDAASRVFPLVRAFLIGVAIAGLYVYGVVKRAATAIAGWLGGFDLGGVDALTIAMYAGMGAVGALVGSLVLLAGALALIGISVFVAALPFLILVAIVVATFAAIIYAIDWLKGKITAIGAYLESLDFGEVGSNLVRSIADGIKNGATWVMNAIKDLASRAAKTLLAAFEIASPSKLGLRVGRNVGGSVGLGIEREAPAVAGSVARLSSAAVSAPLASGQGSSGRASVGQIGPFYFTVDSEERAREITRRVMDLFEQAVGEAAPA